MEYYNVINPNYLSALNSHTIKYLLKVELMDYNENVLDEITEDISQEDAGSISINYQQGVRRSCSITLINTFKKYNPSPENLIWCNTKFKIYTGISVYNNTTDEEDYYWFSQGVYILTNPNVLRSMSKKTITLNGVDKFGIFGSETNFHELDGTYLIPANTTLKNIVIDILGLDMGNGNKLDPKFPKIDSYIGELHLPYEIKKSPESFFSEILIELGNIFACDIYYDGDGYLNFVKGNEYNFMDNESPLWHYTDAFSEYGDANLELKFTEVYNVIKVIGNNPASKLYETVLKNTDPTSPTRVDLIGERSKYIESSFCYSQARTDDFAKYLLKKYSIMQLAISFSSAFIPHLDVNKAISIDDEYYNYKEQKFIIQGLTIPLSSNAQISVEATNTANIPYFEY